MKPRTLHLTLATLTLLAVAAPLVADATAFSDPLGGIRPVEIIKRAIQWLLGLVGFFALLALVIGGTRLIIGGFGSENDIAEGKRIIYWAIIGLIVVGMAAAILAVVGYVLGLRSRA